MKQKPSTILIIAGSDSGGGAGIQADIKTSCAHGVFATTAITALTAQNTQGVQGIYDVSPEFVAAQIEAVLHDIEISAIKIGMLNNAEVIEAVADCLKKIKNGTPIILDTVMVSSSGDKLLKDNAITALKEHLFPLATLITPNIPEAEILTDMEINSVDDMISAANKLTTINHQPSILIKGGHLKNDEITDILFHEGAIHKTHNSKLKTQNTHGTGCTLASAIACNMANGQELKKAVENAISYVRKAIQTAPNIGLGKNKPLNHLHNQK
ncbi:MAG: bifunctional hydroxymethylpyrimidine kinase/phosphomethylpyrimidine kinase [Alphaproteobacteria bacterium CG11_big_fil_rev_8_21_14_0_20_44_7]|nr:MAG: bifunctional hydroxymethylpyrimidine kinase/phosphomethylpyrimidine kinase [Alphaproteobacteria bacterium CG11_big_fil_rev_8_21_14_0_20_44_7]